MQLFLFGLAVLIGGGLVSLFCSRWARLANGIGGLSAAAGSILAAIPALQVLATGQPSELYAKNWQLPFASFALQLNPISAWFAAIILSLSALAAIYGIGYMRPYAGKKSLGASWLFYNLLVATMTLVVSARNGMLFMLAWEGMALSSYFLVAFEDEKPNVREAGRVYLIASHLGVAFLLAFFVLVGAQSGSLDFDKIAQTGNFTSQQANVLFLLAIVGFGVKAGFLPLHVWLPDAHPAAPSHVSAVMSGVMIKTGIYGVVLTLSLLGHPPLWWGWLLVAIGATSGVLGVLFALAQHDLKRLLAYHSVENIGIIALGLGVGFLGISLSQPTMATLGFAGALLHVLNHAVFKGLLFLGAGAVIHSSHTASLDQLGGLMKRMPWTAVTFLVGAVAICGLPPLNGFASELLIYVGSFQEEVFSGVGGAVPALAVIGSLAAIGGLAASCFTKAFGVVFLGEPRSENARQGHDPGLLMIFPMVVLAMACLLIGLFAPQVIPYLNPALSLLTHVSQDKLTLSMASATTVLASVTLVACILLGLIGLLAAIRYWLLANRQVGTSPTWDCGFAAPTPHMQYTASSFAEPIVDFHQGILRPSVHFHPPQGLFPDDAALETHTADLFMHGFYARLFGAAGWVASKLSWIQHGRLSLYVLYIALTLLVLLVWYFGIEPAVLPGIN